MAKHPVLISGIGFFLCVVSYIMTSTFGDSAFSETLFWVGIGICSVGVLIGFFTFKQEP